MNYKEYTISFYGKQFNKKPDGKEAAIISQKLKSSVLTYDFLAVHVGELGCSFAPAVFQGSRKAENFFGMQLFAIDIDEGVSFIQMKERADRFHLPILFAYKSFSWREDYEKFRVVFAADHMVTDAVRAQDIQYMLMQIFEECDQHCSDLSRLFYGSNQGLLYFAEKPEEFTVDELTIALNCYMFERYGEKHYTSMLHKFYHSAGISSKKKVPSYTVSQETQGRRKTSNIDFSILKERCRLYRDFADGNEYYYYPQLFHIATNLINADKGKKQFLDILNSTVNSAHSAYHIRNWKVILNVLIDMNYQPQSCNKCPYASACPHYKNMLLTVDAGKCGIRPIEKKDYVTIQEAEESLEENFKSAVEGNGTGIRLIIAQTGLGKTNTYLHYLKSTDKRFIIAAPTHKLIRELYEKALEIGVTNVICMPEFPDISPELTAEIEHIYHIGAGKIGLHRLRMIADTLKPDDPDYIKIEDFFEKLDAAYSFEGHILMTHQRFLYLKSSSQLLEDRTVIIDEDILAAVFATVSVRIEDIKTALSMDYFTSIQKERMQNILNGSMYQRYHESTGVYLLEDDLADKFDDIHTNILDLLNARVLVKYDDDITYIKRQMLPTFNVIIMSATVNPKLYGWLFPNTPIRIFQCKQAKYKGNVIQYTDSSYSRKKLTNDESAALINNIRQIVNDTPVITFKCVEQVFHTNYHFGAIEGLNILKGKNIAVVGLPNMNETVYKLYGMLMGVDPEKDTWQYRKIQYNGYEFYLNTFINERLRTIQLWMIESNLEQAVGRARLLRCQCSVTVFGRFPIDQAEIV